MEHYGEFGDYRGVAQGNTGNFLNPVQIKIDEDTYLTNVRKIAVDRHGAMALTTDGEVYVWGNTSYTGGQGSNVNLSTYAIKVKDAEGTGFLSNIIDISMAENGGLAIDKNGKVWSWGYITYVLTGNSSYYLPVHLTSLTNMISVSLNSSNTAAFMKYNGNMYGIGSNAYGELGIGDKTSRTAPYNLGNDINKFEFGSLSGYIVKEDGTLWSAGNNDRGRLGLGDTTERTTFTQVKFEDGTEVKPKYIAAGPGDFVIINEDRKAYIAGANYYMEFSNRTATNSSWLIPFNNKEQTQVSDAIALAAGGYSSDGAAAINQLTVNTAIIRKNGTVWVSGLNDNGQMGQGFTSSSGRIPYNLLNIIGMTQDVNANVKNKYIKVGDTTDIIVLSVEGFNVFIPDDAIDQSDWTWKSLDEDVATVNANGVITGVSLGTTTIMGEDSKGNKAKAIIHVYRNQSGAITVPQVETDGSSTIVLKEDGTVWAVGYNGYGQLGQRKYCNSI